MIFFYGILTAFTALFNEVLGALRGWKGRRSGMLRAVLLDVLMDWNVARTCSFL